MLPVLIVCFARPENLRLLLDMPEVQMRRIYIFVDGVRKPGKIKELNDEVLKTIYANNHGLSIKLLRSEVNLGVQKAVPMAIEWVMESENRLIVLEDDCIPSTQAFRFFDQQILNLNSKTVMVCGSAPKRLDNEIFRLDSTRLADYPLIWGWATDKRSWSLLVVGINRRNTPWFRIILKSLVAPRRVLALLFFAAANVRVKHGTLKAWDSPVALEMLIKSYKAILPLESLITNNGNDQVASHPPINHFLNSRQPRKSKDVNRRIEQEIYNLKSKHVFSPLKAYLQILKIKSPKKIKFFSQNQCIARIFNSRE